MSGWSTLKELSRQYRAAAEPLRARLKELRAELKTTDDPETVWLLKRRIAELTPILTEMNALSEVTDRYYESGYYRDERYSVNGIPKIELNGEKRRYCSFYNRKGAFDGEETEPAINEV